MIFIFFILVFIISNFVYTIPSKTLFLVPGEQGISCCRVIGDYYVSGLNSALCEEVALLIKQKQKSCLVRIVKTPVSTRSHQFALAEEINIQNPDLVVHIGLCPQLVKVPSEVPSLDFFCYDQCNPLIKQNNQVSLPALVKVEHAHMQHSKKSFECAEVAQKVIDHLAQKGLYKSLPVQRISFLPLKGIVAPAFACEMIIEKPYDWKRSVQDIADACIAALYD